MTDFKHNNDKPSALLTGYSTVRGAELKAIYKTLESQGEVPVSTLEKRFGRPMTSGYETEHIDQSLKFLRAIDMVDVSAQNVVSLSNEDVYSSLSFEARVLHHVRKQPGKQYHLTYIFDVLAKQNCRRVTEENLLEAVKADSDRSFDLTWRGEKIRMWANLFDPLGAISYVNDATDLDENEIIASPTRALMYELLAWYAENGEDSKRFARALKWIDEEFMPVFADRPGVPKLAAGVADVLNDIEMEGAISLQTMSDAGIVASLPRSNGAPRNVATYTVESLPDRPAYWYPLDRNERRLRT
ncbi:MULTISPECIES: hypothetical protein [Haloferax]|uniref:Uncharacterized protein n=2 Tax=Haloferax TaxID=2251 RepID=A0A6G1Z7L1_9EURY|nr:MULTISPECIES: hypothetical protein [Haloferax]KAB1184761.1 hypothetical protein Hfx1149_16985 [Haloferax sp. CBA1149]MRW82391.1 hypothetical protein [Haloferax marinisediminis]